MKRIMIAGTKSGCGKTTVTCALLKALVNRGKKVASFKCGPDYIDPMFHRVVIGTSSYNLDSYFFDENTLKYLFAKHSLDISVIEGVMGFYDGLEFTDSASSHEISVITDTPVVLVVNAKGIGNSVGAVIKGFLDYSKSNIKGVIFNGVTHMTYERMKKLCEGLKVKPLGYFPYTESAAIESRHLGLVTAAEIDDIKERMEQLARTAEECLDIDGILELCSESRIKYSPVVFDKIADVRIAVTDDRAFCFHYRESLELLEELGAELVYFSPLADKKLPDGINGLILSGGYPELYAAELEENKAMRESIRSVILKNIPCMAECGGFMYLHEHMGDYKNKEYDGVGVIPGGCRMLDSLQNFGYIKMTAQKDNLLCKRGESIRAHEFHYFCSDANGDAFVAEKGSRSWRCVVAEGNLFAGFPHINFYANPEFAKNFIRKCADVQTEKA